MDIRALVEAKARAACGAKTALALTPTRLRNEALLQMGRGLEEKARPILEANGADLDRARARGHPRAFLDRLTLTDGRIEEMAQGLRQIAALPDPIGETVDVWRRPNGLEISRVRVPLGVIGFVYEARPKVTADAAGLCLKSGNAVVLRGGSEAIESNTMIAALLAKAVEKAGAPPEAIQFVDTPDRAAVAVMLELDRVLDLVIPRGGEDFVRWVAERSRVPILKHDKGLVHVYLDAAADPDMADAIVVNAKVQRPSVCNALETLLVHQAAVPRRGASHARWTPPPCSSTPRRAWSTAVSSGSVRRWASRPPGCTRAGLSACGSSRRPSSWSRATGRCANSVARTALLGGSFNPIHYGHLVLADDVRERLSLERVLFMPAGEPPHKPVSELAPAADRYAMVRLALADTPAFDASDLQLHPAGPSYTVDTVAALGIPPDELFLVIGSETFLDLLSWREPRRLAPHCRIAVIPRAGSAFDADGAAARKVLREIGVDGIAAADTGEVP